MDRTAVFRADAGADIGGGHVMRCLTLADGMAERGWRSVFAVDEDTLRSLPLLTHSRHDVFTVPAKPADQPGALRRMWPNGVEWLVVDHYGLDATFENACRPWTERIMVIDDLADRRHDADVLLDQGLGRQPREYDGLVDKRCERLCGSSYTLLKPEFGRARERALSRRKPAPEAPRILVTFGATDPSNVTLLSLRAAQAVAAHCAVDVILGGGAPHRSEVAQFVDRMPDEVCLHVDVGDMAPLMTRADLGMSAAGATVWEFCGLGLPSLVTTVAENQRHNEAALRQAGAAWTLGPLQSLDYTRLCESLEKLVGNAGERERLSDNAARVCDCHGLDRVVDIVCCQTRSKTCVRG